MVRADDYRRTVRRGRRVNTQHALLYLASSTPLQPTRVGFIVSKSVGNSVVRNLVTRRLRSIGREFVQATPVGMDVVIRALPGSSTVPWVTLHGEILNGLERSAGK